MAINSMDDHNKSNMAPLGSSTPKVANKQEAGLLCSSAETEHYDKISSEMVKKCKLCKEIVAKFFCSECDLYICKSCDDIVSAHYGPQKSPHEKQNINRYSGVFCPKCEEKDKTFFVEDLKQVSVCEKCNISAHLHLPQDLQGKVAYKNGASVSKDSGQFESMDESMGADDTETGAVSTLTEGLIPSVLEISLSTSGTQSMEDNNLQTSHKTRYQDPVTGYVFYSEGYSKRLPQQDYQSAMLQKPTEFLRSKSPDYNPGRSQLDVQRQHYDLGENGQNIEDYRCLNDQQKKSLPVNDSHEYRSPSSSTSSSWSAGLQECSARTHSFNSDAIGHPSSTYGDGIEKDAMHSSFALKKKRSESLRHFNICENLAIYGWFCDGEKLVCFHCGFALRIPIISNDPAIRNHKPQKHGKFHRCSFSATKC